MPAHRVVTELDKVSLCFVDWNQRRRYFAGARAVGDKWLPAMFRPSCLPNLYIRGAWPDGTPTPHGDAAFGELIDCVREFLSLPQALAKHAKLRARISALTSLAAVERNDVQLLSDVVADMFQTPEAGRQPATSSDKSTQLGKVSVLCWFIDAAIIFKLSFQSPVVWIAWKRCRRPMDLLSLADVPESQQAVLANLNTAFFIGIISLRYAISLIRNTACD